ncbi:MAG TPA: hypothetical protein VG055_09525 [Planctomycetaceae bacterium]|jgi:hypothetical protein|nr:hypothetical protein [Planctomycetaceae bacterium]
MRDEPRASWDERLIKRLKRAANGGEIARTMSQAIGLTVLILFWITSLDLIWQSLRPPD